jgi:Icc-related predicted phosphoesterase
MRVFAISDLHVDYSENKRWVSNVSASDYLGDVLICAGDISHETGELAATLTRLRKSFLEVLFVPGNHELWVGRNGTRNSIEKFAQVLAIAGECGARTSPLHLPEVFIAPLFAWYDFSFGAPSADLLSRWSDFHNCSWPEEFDALRITDYFLSMNQLQGVSPRQPIVSYSHFVPREDLLPAEHSRTGFLRPVLGSTSIEKQIRTLGSRVHVYGHYHVNGSNTRDHVTYVNNALGYPREYWTARKLACIFQT